MSTAIAIRPYTLWNLLDSFIIQLGMEGDEVCNRRTNEDRFYNTLVDLVCIQGSVKLLDGLVIEKPLYPYILLTYYVLFFKGDFSLAKALYNKLSDSRERYSRLFDENEETSLKILEKVITFFDALNKSDRNNHRNILRHHLEILMNMLKEAQCIEHDWSCLFRDLIVSHLDINLEQIRKIYKDITRACATEFEPIDKELIDGYNLFIDKSFKPVCMFLPGVASRRLRAIEYIYDRLYDLESKKKSLEERLSTIQQLQKKLRIYVENVRGIIYILPMLLPPSIFYLLITLHITTTNWLTWIISFSPLVIYVPKGIEIILKQKIKKIEKKIIHLKSSEIERLANIIWSS